MYRAAESQKNFSMTKVLKKVWLILLGLKKVWLWYDMGEKSMTLVWHGWKKYDNSI